VADLKKLLVDPERRTLASVARRRRYELFLGRFPDLADMSVLDLGGEAHTWVNSPVHPKSVTLLNFKAKASDARGEERIAADHLGDWMSAVVGDACDPPEELRERRFDLVYSNSVIEHVGGHLRRRHFSYWAQTLGEHHWVQTPNRYFPIEPHWLAPGLQFAPPRVQGAVLSRWPLVTKLWREREWNERIQKAMGIELLSPGALRSYFPTSELIRERMFGMTKSLIVVGQAG
jgi:hypothetical protein